MFPRPFDGAPDRWFWLHGRAEAEEQAARFVDACSAWGRGPPARVLIVGAFPALADALQRRGVEVALRDPDLQRVAGLQLQATARDDPMPNVGTAGLPDDLDAVVAPAGMLGYFEDDEALLGHLRDVTAALRPGGVYVGEVWHPRLADPDTGPTGPLPVRAFGSLPGGRARFHLFYGETPPPVMKVEVHVERGNGLPLARTEALTRLLTLAEWRASVAATHRLEEASVKGPLSTFREHHPDVGDRCTLVWTRVG